MEGRLGFVRVSGTGCWDDSSLSYTSLFNVSWFRYTGFGRVDDDSVFLVAWLGSGTVLTFNEVDVCLGRTLLRSRELSVNFGWFVVTRLTLTFKLKVYFRRLTALMMVVMMMFTTGKFDINFRVFVVTITVSFKRSFEVSVVMWGVDIEGSRVVFVFVFGSKRRVEKTKESVNEEN